MVTGVEITKAQGQAITNSTNPRSNQAEGGTLLAHSTPSRASMIGPRTTIAASKITAGV